MSSKRLTPLEVFLEGHDDAAWRDALGALLPAVHEVDRNAVRIWFHFYPLALHLAFESAEDPARLAQRLLMQGEWRLKDRLDSSHGFLYGSRFWPEIKRAVVRLAGRGEVPAGRTLAELITEVAREAAAERKVEESLATGIAAVGLMTLRQAGLEEFERTPGEVSADRRHLKRTPEQVLRERAKDDGQGLFGFLRTTDRRWTVVWDESAEDRRFRALDKQEIATAAANDKRPWHEQDARCTVDEGPIPVQCRSASCGTCWVGVLGGAEKLSPADWRERRMMPLFGYVETDDPRPLIRLACQARAEGAVSVVIPPWNGYFGKYLKRAGAGSDVEAGEAGEAVASS